MSYWGVSAKDADGFVHIVPCDDERNILPPHVLSADCPCHPTLDEDEPSMLVHNDSQRSHH